MLREEISELKDLPTKVESLGQGQEGHYDCGAESGVVLVSWLRNLASMIVVRKL